MLSGWEEETSPLTDEEKQWAEFIARIINKYHIGKENACTSTRIIDGIEKNFDVRIGPVRVRKMIHEIRVTRQCKRLISSSKGYYIATDPMDQKRYIESLTQRIEAIQRIKDAAEEDLKVWTTGQQKSLNLPS